MSTGIFLPLFALLSSTAVDALEYGQVAVGTISVEVDSTFTGAFVVGSSAFAFVIEGFTFRRHWFH